jgi:23S rRNA (uracil1939-C5)-methyltransferase
MAPLKHLDIVLTQAVYGGDCLARMEDGRALFVPFGLPGETVRVEVVEEKRTFVRARLVEVLAPASQRITARCPHFGDCGGCHYQHIPYDLQLTLKQDVVREQFQRIATLADPPVRPIIPSPAIWNYRNAIQFHLDAEGKLGFLGASSHRVVAIKECHLPEPGLDEVWRQFDIEPLPGLERIEFRMGSDGDALVVLESNSVDMPEVEIEMPLSLVHSSPFGEVVLSGQEALPLSVLERDFVVSATSFFQVNSAQAGNMVTYLLQSLPLDATTTVLLDVYCGVGLFSAFMAPKVKNCIGIELSPTACRDFATNLDEFENVSLYEGAAEDVLPGLELKADVVIVDPPRAGLDVRALDAIVALHPGVLAYISCDPATLARDTKRLMKSGYHLESVQPFDLFPHTFHVETISLFKS